MAADELAAEIRVGVLWAKRSRRATLRWATRNGPPRRRRRGAVVCLVSVAAGGNDVAKERTDEFLCALRACAACVRSFYRVHLGIRPRPPPATLCTPARMPRASACRPWRSRWRGAMADAGRRRTPQQDPPV